MYIVVGNTFAIITWSYVLAGTTVYEVSLRVL